MSTIINLQMEVLARMREHRDEIFRFGPRGRADRPSFQQPPRPRDGERRRDGERSDGASASLASISEADEAAEAETDGSLKAPMAPAKSREREGSSLRRNEKERDGGRQRLPPHADSAPVEWNLLPVSEQSEGDGISYERRICESVVIEKEGFCPSGLINPHWIGKLVWDFGVMFCVLMDAMVLPFQLTFKSNLGADSFDTVWLWTTTWIFGIDIIFSFNCAIESEDGVHGAKSKLILDRVKIAKSYLRGWFAIDFGSTVPWAQLSEAWLSGGSSSQLTRLTKVVKFVRLLRLVRMLRLAKLGQIWERVEHRIGSLFLLQCISLLRVLSVVVAMCHWSACLFWLIGLPRNIFTDVFFSEDEQQAYEAAPHWTTIWRHHDAVETSWRWLDRSTSETYVFCFYWTLGVMRTMPAEVTPVNLPERVFVLIFMFFALSAFAISIALITQSFFKLSERKKAFNEEYAAVRLHLQRTKVSEDIQFRVKSYLKYLFDQRKTHAKEATLLNSLPDELKDQVFRCQALHHMMRLPNMQHFRRSHRLRLAAAAATCDFMPGQALVKRNDPIEASWILISGQLHKDGWNVDEYPTVVHAECLEPHGHEPLLSDCQVVATEVSEVLRVDKVVQVQQLLIRVDILERRLSEVASRPSRGIRACLSLPPRAPSPARTSSSASSAFSYPYSLF
ncbi:unnamed protein product [Durusdinium trenchii]|uniref:Ion transport domain-containing protein n=1 Tax=Durusdinium trenchii TaxID=1381693 RepID=A0ABP0I864_9DINO